MTPRRTSSGITLCQRRSVGFLRNPMWSADQSTYHLHSVSALICPTFPLNLRPTNPPLQPGRQPIPVFPCSIRILSTYYTRFRILFAYYSSIAHILNTYYVGADRYYMHIICVLFHILSAYYLVRCGISRLVSRHGLACWGGLHIIWPEMRDLAFSASRKANMESALGLATRFGVPIGTGTGERLGQGKISAAFLR